MRRKPDFFIIGAPKCGTTALAEYLRSHPLVFVSEPKEPEYFNADHNLLGLPATVRKYRSDDDYLVCFQNATDRHIALGEASPWYLYSEVAIDNILRFNPDAKFIAMLRNPVDLACALHAEFLFSGYENIPDFESAWDLQDERRHARRLPPGRVEPKVLLYGEVAKLGKQLAKLYEKVPRERVLVVCFENFTAHTAAVYATVLEFLSVPHDGRSDFPVINPRKRVRWPQLHKLLVAINRNPVATRLALDLQRIFGVTSLRLAQRVLMLNTVSEKRPELPETLRARLQQYFAEDQRLLSVLLNDAQS